MISILLEESNEFFVATNDHGQYRPLGDLIEFVPRQWSRDVYSGISRYYGHLIEDRAIAAMLPVGTLLDRQLAEMIEHSVWLYCAEDLPLGVRILPSVRRT